MAIGMAALVYTFVHKDLKAEVKVLEEKNSDLRRANRIVKQKFDRLEKIKKEMKELEKTKKIIEKVREARGVPADLLAELSQILSDGSEGGDPTDNDSTKTQTKSSNGPVKGKPTRIDDKMKYKGPIRNDWDPHRVWITSFIEKEGEFVLNGGAPSDDDMTQLALRMEESVYFRDVIPEDGEQAVEKNSGLTFMKFRITGKVVY